MKSEYNPHTNPDRNAGHAPIWEIARRNNRKGVRVTRKFNKNCKRLGGGLVTLIQIEFYVSRWINTALTHTPKWFASKLKVKCALWGLNSCAKTAKWKLENNHKQ